MTTVAFAGLAARILSERPRCGGTRLVCVDGPSGSGKTTFAARLAVALDGPPVLHMDDLYPGWDGLAASVGLLVRTVVAPIAAGRPARYRRYDWSLGTYAESHHLGVPDMLVVEGVGSGAREVADGRGLLIWVEAPRDERHRRGMERDSGAYRPFWERWARQEKAHFAAERTRNRADLRVDGAPAAPHEEETQFVRLT